jgi:hypothetical protein
MEAASKSCDCHSTAEVASSFCEGPNPQHFSSERQKVSVGTTQLCVKSLKAVMGILQKDELSAFQQTSKTYKHAEFWFGISLRSRVP